MAFFTRTAKEGMLAATAFEKSSVDSSSSIQTEDKTPHTSAQLLSSETSVRINTTHELQRLAKILDALAGGRDYSW